MWFLDKMWIYAPVCDPGILLCLFCDFYREKSPVGGISVKAHFEINLVPLTIGITQAFYKRIMAFCFPEKISDITEEQENSKDKKGKKHAKDKSLSKKSANFYVESPLNQDDVEEMKVRAQQNKLFVYIKIPEVPICVSYKGEKEKNKILDVANFRLQVPIFWERYIFLRGSLHGECSAWYGLFVMLSESDNRVWLGPLCLRQITSNYCGWYILIESDSFFQFFPCVSIWHKRVRSFYDTLS